MPDTAAGASLWALQERPPGGAWTSRGYYRPEEASRALVAREFLRAQGRDVRLKNVRPRRMD